MTVKLLRTVMAILATAATMLTLGAVNTARADVYTQPGGHAVNGRLWQTECSMYSSTVVRCRTDIWATQVKYQGGHYVRVTDWAFNNLTYLPSPRGQWANNPLGKTGTWTATDGRQWRTVCDTPETGSNACRSYVMARVASATATPSGWSYSVESKWVFNNIVVFSTASRPPVHDVPPSVLETAKLSHGGFGPLAVGASLVDLARLGYVEHNTSDVCDYYEVSDEVADLGLAIVANGHTLDVLIATTAAVETTLGVKVGQTYTQANTAYSAGGYTWEHETKDGYQPVYVYKVVNGTREMLFLDDFEATSLPDSNTPIGMIIVRQASNTLMWDGC
ncbi:hypothetical protein FOJ82_04935 [Tessaracoccus rhinocerotis]|uniref:Uncharacterized protein n=1 Tax=Tessaracoccus rhinocerotis TaxID=1689449 RepID=A0A553K679_9ACTN|nr:hypothetical protein [Tessaracoccus rhinocerotis]TRY20209.1 hypothetical protein FOJ82_04935 [Tessaracoccus rhinocerotis]